MAAPSFLEGAGGTGLHALEVQDIYDEATVAVHDPEVGYMHTRQELKGAEVLWGGHSLVLPLIHMSDPTRLLSYSYAFSCLYK